MNTQVPLFTNYAHVLMALHHDPDVRQRDIANQVGITEGAVQRILHDLIESGHVNKARVGRRNHYEINHSAQLRHPAASHAPIAALLAMFASASSSPDLHRDHAS